MPTALFLVAFGVVCRLLVANFETTPATYYLGVPMGAIALYAAARLSRGWALAVPVLVLALSDLVIDRTHYSSMLDFLPRATTYVFYLAIVAVGALPARNAHFALRLGMAVGSATLFFLISNFVVWATGGGFARADLISAYVDGLLFYRAQLLADVLGAAALFGVVDLLMASAKANRPVEVTVE